MNISFENADKVNGLLTIQMEKADYEKQVEKTLKDYSKKVRMPGFRPGKVPMSLVKKQFGVCFLILQTYETSWRKVEKGEGKQGFFSGVCG